MKKEFIGIDVSKLTLDVHLYFNKSHNVFSNDENGFKSMTKWLKQLVKDSSCSIKFCFEHTGIYSMALSIYLKDNNESFYMVSGLAVKRSMGLKRGKTDKTDAFALSKYLFQNESDLSPTKLPTENIQKLQFLLSFRSNLVKQLAGYKTHKKECGSIYYAENNTIQQVVDQNIKNLKESIKQIDNEILSIIQSDNELDETYKNLTSIKGVGPVLGVTMIVITKNFTAFKTSRQLACYAGIVPFEHSSGTSYRGKTRVSSLGNRTLKSLLTMAAISSINYNPEMKIYFNRRVEEGKSKMSTINIVRNKLVSRMFAVVTRKSPYVETCKFAA
jgi:transposase